MAKTDEIAVYRAYIRAKANPKAKVLDVANDFGLTRAGVYDIVRRIENGNVSKIRKCTEASKLSCLWEYKYKARYLSIPEGRTKESVEMLKVLIKDMFVDGFTAHKISSFTGKDRSTIIHHINNL
jgi:predicted transcriptional regulator